MINQLTFTRFVAAIVVVIYHYGRTTPTFSGETISTLMKYGNSAVSYFFILSGFVMIINYGKWGTKLDKISYYVNRIARIYPIYMIALIVMAMIALQSSEGLNMKAFMLQSLLMQAWFPTYVMELNLPGWSLSVEMFFYILFPFLLSLYHRINLKKLSFSVLIFWLITQVIFNFLLISQQSVIPTNFLFYAPIMHLNQFLIGNLIGFLYFKSKKRNYDALVIFMVLALPVLLLFIDWYGSYLSYHNGLMACYYAPLILLIALNNGKISSWLSKKVFIVLGEISYAIYILQKPIHNIVMHVGEALSVNHTLMLFIFFFILIVASLISYYVIELPTSQFIKMRYSKLKDRQNAVVSN